MSEQTQSPLPKTPRKGSRSSRTASSSEQHVQNQGRSGRGGRRGGRGGHNQQQRQTQDSEASTQEPAQGDFDENGTYVESNNSQVQQLSGGKRPVQKPSNSTNYVREQPIPASHQQMPFPTLRGTPHKPYAGPTFHASPAASALPMPRFFSKSVPNPASAAPSLQERVDQESLENKTTSQETTPEQSPSVSKSNVVSLQPRNESPLDIFFSAARAEKAKGQSPAPIAVHSSIPPQQFPVSQITTSASSSSNAPRSSKPPSHWASIYGGTRPSHQRNFSADSGKGLFMMEMDGKSQPQQRSPPSQSNHSSILSATPPASVHRTVSDGVHHTPVHRQSPMYAAANYGISTPVLPSEMDGTPARYSGNFPFHHQSQTNPAPRSAGSTPFQTPPPSTHHSKNLHYGNKNLSPMFQAAKTNSPRNRSQLRKELPESPTIYANELPGSLPGTKLAGSQQQIMASNQANIAAQKYLSDMISRSSSSSSLPPHGQPSGPPRAYSNGIPAHQSPFRGNSPPHQSPVRDNKLPLRQQPTGGSTVTRTMEDDLRRMLKISEN